MDLDLKYAKLKGIIGGLKKVIVACSGGVDSTLLLKVSVDVLGRANVIAVIASSPIYPDEDIQEAGRIAKTIGAEYMVVDTLQLNNINFVNNSIDRCYYCKKIIIDELITIGKKRGINNITEGSNYDDISDFRPGNRACREKGVASPLQMAGLTKKEIRELSRALGLHTADRPSDACLATRIPHGTPIDRALLGKVGRSERFIKELGVRQARVRCHGSIARIEVAEGDLEKIMMNRDAVAERLREYGFMYIALDLEGYRSGSMNETA
ncbi:MAG: ATP-dependent sacrificial sulfur transferase LarE [Syntrophorhabdaceae bacterium]|nr:ATP-dependent sacrificial sulfur transferase LarE [Syntrophorhabdaceae bacterium]